jgi:hypothetical protein
MNRFSEFTDIKMPDLLDGKKIPIRDVFDKKIIVLNYRIKPSRYADSNNDNCLTLQFTFEGESERRVVFSGSRFLIDVIEQCKSRLPFETVIKKEGKNFIFT